MQDITEVFKLQKVQAQEHMVEFLGILHNIFQKKAKVFYLKAIFLPSPQEKQQFLVLHKKHTIIIWFDQSVRWLFL